MNQALALCAGYAACVASGIDEGTAALGCDSDFMLAQELIDFWGMESLSDMKARTVDLLSNDANVRAIRFVADALLSYRTIGGGFVDLLIDRADGLISENELNRFLARIEQTGQSIEQL